MPSPFFIVKCRLITDKCLNVLKTDGSPNPDVLAIGDAAEIQNTPLPATAQGQPLFIRVTTKLILLRRVYFYVVSPSLLQWLIRKRNTRLKG
jgi:hypothetical protein